MRDLQQNDCSVLFKSVKAKKDMGRRRLRKDNNSLHCGIILDGILQEEKGTTEDEMAGWYHQLDGHEFE